MHDASADVQRITLNASCMTISDERTEQLDIVAGFKPSMVWLRLRRLAVFLRGGRNMGRL